MSFDICLFLPLFLSFFGVHFGHRIVIQICKYDVLVYIING